MKNDKILNAYFMFFSYTIKKLTLLMLVTSRSSKLPLEAGGAAAIGAAGAAAGIAEAASTSPARI